MQGGERIRLSRSCQRQKHFNTTAAHPQNPEINTWTRRAPLTWPPCTRARGCLPRGTKRRTRPPSWQLPAPRRRQSTAPRDALGPRASRAHRPRLAFRPSPRQDCEQNKHKEGAAARESSLIVYVCARARACVCVCVSLYTLNVGRLVPLTCEKKKLCESSQYTSRFNPPPAI